MGKVNVERAFNQIIRSGRGRIKEKFKKSHLNHASFVNLEIQADLILKISQAKQSNTVLHTYTYIYCMWPQISFIKIFFYFYS